MRALRVIGLDRDGAFVICQDKADGDFYRLPVDERLRAAVRGDTASLEQLPEETADALRPREIQARIRAGESVQQVAAAAGLPEQRIERFAYPVLLERARTAELAQRAHPIREDGPDVQTLGEVITHAFVVRGHDHANIEWDAWRNEDGKWIVQLRWLTGRSDNQAHWMFQPGAQGGTVIALDEHANALLDPTPNRALRTVQPQVDPAQQVLDLGDHEYLRSQPAVENGSNEQPPKNAARANHQVKKSHPIVPSWEDVFLGIRSRS